MNQADIRLHLVAARALIDTPERWAQHSFYRTTKGRRFNHDKDEQEIGSRCASAAIADATAKGYSLYAAVHLRETFQRHTGQVYLGVPEWNDAPERTHAEIMQGFDWAISEDYAEADSAEVAA